MERNDDRSAGVSSEGAGMPAKAHGLPRRVAAFVGRLIRRLLIAAMIAMRGVLVAVGVVVGVAILGYIEFESIAEFVDSRYSDEIDAHLGIEKSTIARLHDPAYFARESLIVS